MTTLRSSTLPLAVGALCRRLSAAAFASALVLGIPAQALPAPPVDRAAEGLARGTALVQAGRFADAIPELERADQLAGGRSAAIEVALARAYAGAGAHARALDEARAALALDPLGNTGIEARILLCQNRPEAAGGGETGEAPRKGDGGGERPQILYRVNPQYPPELRRSRAQGTVTLEAVIDEEGCVASARVLHGAAPGFDAAALAAVMQWVFRPALADGQAVKVSYVLTTTFEIEKGTPPPAAPGGDVR